MKHKFNSSPNSPVQLAEFSSCGPNSPTSSPNSPKIPLGRIVNGPNSPDPIFSLIIAHIIIISLLLVNSDSNILLCDLFHGNTERQQDALTIKSNYD